jgi:hypothetical protein
LWRRSDSLGKTPQDWSFVSTVEGCFGKIWNIGWRPNKLEFATTSEDGCVRVWKVVEEHGRVSVKLAWARGRAALVASGAVLTGTVGLSVINSRIFEQRGAIMGSSLEDGA